MRFYLLCFVMVGFTVAILLTAVHEANQRAARCVAAGYVQLYDNLCVDPRTALVYDADHVASR